MADSWCLFDGARQLGPLSLSELKHFLEVKSLPDVQVWREGLNEWAAPSDLPEFAPVEPPPIPTISEDGRGQGADDEHCAADGGQAGERPGGDPRGHTGPHATTHAGVSGRSSTRRSPRRGWNSRVIGPPNMQQPAPRERFELLRPRR